MVGSPIPRYLTYHFRWDLSPSSAEEPEHQVVVELGVVAVAAEAEGVEVEEEGRDRELLVGRQDECEDCSEAAVPALAIDKVRAGHTASWHEDTPDEESSGEGEDTLVCIP